MSFEELVRYQDSLVESLKQKNSTFSDAVTTLDIDKLLIKTSYYLTKLHRIKRDMEMIKEKTGRIKRKALRLQQEQQEFALQKELRRDQLIQKEKHLAPIIMKNTDDSDG